MKKIYTIAILLFSLFPSTVPAQNLPEAKKTIRGTVRDASNDQAIPYATVALLSPDSTVLNACITDSGGKFRLPIKGDSVDLNLSVSYIGYHSVIRNVAHEEADLGVIHLQPQAYAIGGVSVVGVRPVVEMEADKIVYNVQSDPLAQGSQLVDVMRRVPLLAVSGQGKVSIAGSDRFTLFINGRKSEFYTRNLTEIISALPASAIKKIEVITNPSMVQSIDSESSGIINIVYDRSFSQLFSGTVGGSVDTRGSYKSNLFLLGTMGKLTASIMAGYSGGVISPFSSNEDFQNLESGTRRMTDRWLNDSKSDRNLPVSLDLIYEIDTCNILNLSLSYDNQRGERETGSARTEFDAAMNEVQKYTGTEISDSKNQALNGSIFYQHLFNGPTHTLSAEYKFGNSDYRNDRFSAYRGILGYADNDYQLYNISNTNQHDVSIDYLNAFNDLHTFQTGLRYTHRNNIDDNTSKTWTGTEAGSEIASKMDYTQQILVGYVDYRFSYKGFYLRASSKFDMMFNKLKSSVSTQHTNLQNNFFNFVPDVAVGFSKKGKSLSFYYSQNLTRPSSGVLDPFVNDSDPDRITYGNPDLKTEITHSLAFSSNIAKPKYRILFRGHYRWTNNSVQSYTFLNDAGKYETTYKNMGHIEESSLILWCGYNFSQISNIGLGLNGSYIVIDPNNGMPRKSGFTYSGNVRATFKLWKESFVFGDVGYRGPDFTLQSETNTKGYVSSSIGLNQNLFKKKLNVVLTFNNPIHKVLKTETNTQGVGYSSHQILVTRNIRYVGLQATFRFGTSKRSTQPMRSGVQDDSNSLITPDNGKLQRTGSIK